MKKTVLFALLMMASIGVFANQKTYSHFKEIAVNNLTDTDYQNSVSADNLKEANSQEAVPTNNLADVAHQKAVPIYTILCGQSGDIYEETPDGGSELVGYWYTTCVENGPPYPVHIHYY